QRGRKDLRVGDGDVPVVVFDGREEARQVPRRLLPRFAVAQQAPGQRVVFAEVMIELRDELILVKLLLAGKTEASVRGVGQRHKGFKELLGGWMQAAGWDSVVGERLIGLRVAD